MACASAPIDNVPDNGDAAGDASTQDSTMQQPETSLGAGDTSNAETAPPASESGGYDASGDSAGDSTTPEGSDDALTESGPTYADAPPDSAPEAGAEAAVDGSADVATEPPACAPGCGVHSVCVQGTCTAGNRVFVSNATFTAGLGGYAGADMKCQSAATAASLGGTWKAWVSDNGSSPSARFTQSSIGYRLLDGSVVAANWGALTGGGLTHPIDLDETIKPFQGVSEVWTATQTNGTLSQDGCNSFTTTGYTDPFVFEGLADKTTAAWTSVYQQRCDRSAHLYCFEQ
jgi:hypothetical protein